MAVECSLCTGFFFNHVVQEIRWSDRLHRFNHCPRFPYFMTHFADSMPISSIGGMWFVDLWNPKYAAHIFKVTVAVDMLGNIVWLCPLAPGTSADVLNWDGYGPSRTRGDFFYFGVVGEEVDICALCCQKHTTTECGECHLNYCAECIDLHTCGDKTVY